MHLLAHTAAAALIALAAAPAQAMDAPGGRAAPIALSVSETTDARRLADTLYGPEIAKLRGATVQTGVTDVQGDGVAELVVRITSTATCGDNGCATALSMHRDGRWVEVFRTDARQVALAETRSGGVRDLVVNGSEVWRWDGGAYALDFDTFADTLAFADERDGPASRAARRDAARAFEDAAALDDKITVQVAEGDINGDGVKEKFVRLESAALCGALVGCPLLVYGSLDSGPILRTSSLERVFLTKETWNGSRLIGLTNRQGYELRGLRNQRFEVVRTSYPSAVTPNP